MGERTLLRKRRKRKRCPILIILNQSRTTMKIMMTLTIAPLNLKDAGNLSLSQLPSPSLNLRKEVANQVEEEVRKEEGAHKKTHVNQTPVGVSTEMLRNNL